MKKRRVCLARFCPNSRNSLFMKKEKKREGRLAKVEDLIGASKMEAFINLMTSEDCANQRIAMQMLIRKVTAETIREFIADKILMPLLERTVNKVIVDYPMMFGSEIYKNRHFEANKKLINCFRKGRSAKSFDELVEKMTSAEIGYCYDIGVLWTKIDAYYKLLRDVYGGFWY